MATCRNCGEQIVPSRLFGWVHTAQGVNNFCASNKVDEYAQPAEEA